ncbi:MAG TPA: helix-hairpin-helix domain-containing protein, partial [candidate division Zixibacteria bacterium]|nr:helix-hairpin-helix domain-containing protein [candidate division Zixibacteria bacterium]
SDSLELLPGIGPTKAAAMIAARDTLPFAGPDDLLRVDGIGPKTLQKVRPFIKIAGPETPAP